MERFELSQEGTGFNEKILNADSIDELIEILAQIEYEVPGSTYKQSGVEVAQRISQVRNGHRNIGFVTNAMGIRDKTQELLAEDKIYNSERSRKAREKYGIENF